MDSTQRSYGRRWLDAARYPARRDGAVLCALLVLPWVVALVLVGRHHHLDVGGWTFVLTASVGLPTLWVTWAAYRDSRRSGAAGGGPGLAQVADELAAAAGEQWSREASVRRLNDPYPLPVSWAAADASLTGTWDSLVKLATSSADWPAPPGQGWAAGPDDLAGENRELAGVLARVPTGRLVVLGEPGAGKTMLMVRFVRDLLAQRAEGGPVPVLASVASWNPAEQDLRSWLGTRLLIDYPALAAPPSAGRTESTQAAALLAAGLILPVLDGLDEIPEQVRGPAISRINDALRDGEQVVVTCRTQQYRDAVAPPGGAEVTLRGAAAVQLRPLDAEAVRGYLCDAAAGPRARARWDPVLKVLGTGAPAAQALGTPLMVGLAREIYNPRPGEPPGTLRDPTELCDPALPDRRAVESLLFDAFIPAAYRHDPGGPRKAQDAEKWLVFLARHLERKIASPDLAWWQLRQAISRTTLRLGVVGFPVGIILVAGLVVVLGGVLAVGPGAGLRDGVDVLGLGLSGLLLGLTAAGKTVEADSSGAEAPSRRVRVVFSGLPVGLALGPLTGLGIGLLIGVKSGLAVGVKSGLAVGLGVVLVHSIGTEGGLVTVSHDPATAASPQAVLTRDRQAALLLMLGPALVTGLVAGLGVGLVVGVGWGLQAGFGGLVVGLAFGLVASWTQTAWPSYMVTIGWLAFRNRLPWSLMSFLADAYRRGVLRQAGAVYQFRHVDLQHRLATRP